MKATLLDKPQITWYGYFGSDERVRLGRYMRPLGYDATCSCGWDSRTGGAIRASIQRDIRFHKWEHEIEQELAAKGLDTQEKRDSYRLTQILGAR